MKQPGLLAWPTSRTTSGPRPASADGTRARRDYTAEWCAFVALRHDVAAWILDEARRMAAESRARHPKPRVAVATIFEAARVKFGATINNSWRAPSADWLVTMDPTLDDVIERRVRRVK